MQEIKYRAWDKAKGKILYKGFAVNGDNFYRFTDLATFVETLDNYELMLFTGLLDKNGKEIYEGDILKNEGKTKTRLSDGVTIPSPYWEVSEVMKDKASFMRIIRRQHNSYFGELPSKPREIFEPENYCEVIGNIHEDPELLKG